MRYFLELSYLGTRYHGWQRQPNARSIQQTLEEAVSRLVGETVEITGAGRTDTGVHAACYVAHLDTDVSVADDSGGADFIYHANSILPPDIAVNGITRVDDNAHARFDAIEREYSYYIIPYKDPFRMDTAWQYSVPLDLDAMNEAAAHLLTASDFTSFAKLGSDNTTNICNVTEAQWRREEGGKPHPSRWVRSVGGGEIVFIIRADRFLRNMVRAIVGTLVDVGRGKIAPDRFGEIIAARDLSLSSGGAPAAGLFMTDIRYPGEQETT